MYLCVCPRQRGVVERVLQAKDYVCVQGMPGTGKTTTMVFCIRALVARGHSVLVTSHTNNAVDNVLLKVRHRGCHAMLVVRCPLTFVCAVCVCSPNAQLKAAGVSLLRLGRASRVHGDLQADTLDTSIASGAIDSVDQLKTRLNQVGWCACLRSV